MTNMVVDKAHTDPRGEKSLGDKIEALIHRIPHGEVTLMDIMEIIGSDSLMFLAIFLSLVFLVPVSIPGVSTVFGSAILLIGIARLLSRRLWLPQRIVQRAIPAERLAPVMRRALTWFRRFEKVSRPHRLPQLTTASRVVFFNALSFILAALLLMVPFGFIPFSNTLPAIAIIFLAVGMIQKDGGIILLGHLSNIVTIAYFSLLALGGGHTILTFLRSILG